MCVVHGGGGDRFRELIRWFGESGSSRDPPRPVNTKLANYLACQRPTYRDTLPSILLPHFLFFPRSFHRVLHRDMRRKFRVPDRSSAYRNFLIRRGTVFARFAARICRRVEEYFFFLDFRTMKMSLFTFGTSNERN